MSWLATALGLGYVPLLPGTAGAAAGLLLAVLLGRLGWRMRVVAVAALAAIAVPICDRGARALGTHDDIRIVADEMLTFPVATIAIPVRGHPGLLAATFLVSRALDGIKPPPARRAEALPGGVGVVLDDVVANLWAALLGFAGWRLYRKWYAAA
jgi:phosphatidylglycerophosphatase A